MRRHIRWTGAAAEGLIRLTVSFLQGEFNNNGRSTPDALRENMRAIKDPASAGGIASRRTGEGIEVRGGLVQATLLTDRPCRCDFGAGAAAAEAV